MIEIKDLLNNIKNVLLGEELKKGAIVDAIFQVTNLKISSKDIKIKNSIAYLNIKPIYKNEIFFKKDLLLEKLQEFLGKKSPKDIR